jgi:hypothetical protein
LNQEVEDLHDIPGIAPRKRGRYNRDQRVLVSLLMIFILAISLMMLTYLAF